MHWLFLKSINLLLPFILYILFDLINSLNFAKYLKSILKNKSYLQQSTFKSF